MFKINFPGHNTIWGTQKLFWRGDHKSPWTGDHKSPWNYLCGMKLELESDHKPLECIYGRKSKPSARIERWVLRLQGYNFKVVYRPGKTNIADVLSRLNLKVNRDYGEKYDYVAALVGSSTIPALRSDEIDVASKNDPELVELRQCIQTGDWSNCSCKE